MAVKEINGHAHSSSTNRVECSIYFPTDVFHRIHDQWQRRPGIEESMSFSAFVTMLVEKGMDA